MSFLTEFEKQHKTSSTALNHFSSPMLNMKFEDPMYELYFYTYLKKRCIAKYTWRDLSTLLCPFYENCNMAAGYCTFERAFC